MKNQKFREFRNSKYSRYRSDLEDFEGRVQFFLATRVPTAWELFSEHPDVDAILMDACMHSPEPNTMSLIKRIREAGYNGHLIANSSTSSNNKVLLEAGCDVELPDLKIYAATELMKLLGVKKPPR